MRSKDSINGEVMVLLGCAWAFLMTPLLIVFNILVNGFVFLTLWNWFIIPLFESAPELTMPYAIGLGMIVNYLTYHYVSTEENAVHSILDWLGRIIIRAGTTLLIGWVAAQFI